MAAGAYEMESCDVVIDNALGSALGQIGLILGATGLTAHLTPSRRLTYQHGGVLLGSLVLLGLFGLDGQESRTEGISLVIVYVMYFVRRIARGSFLEHGQKEVLID